LAENPCPAEEKVSFLTHLFPSDTDLPFKSGTRPVLALPPAPIAPLVPPASARRAHGIEAGYPGPYTRPSCAGGVLRMRADLDWHDELDKIIAELPDEDA
jgi:hypothetical protein